MNLVLVQVDNTLKKPGPVFGEMCKISYFVLGSDWYFRVNDDSEILSAWTTPFIKALKGLGYPYGTIGPLCKQGNTKILTHDFVHRTHFQIFDYGNYPIYFIYFLNFIYLSVYIYLFIYISISIKLRLLPSSTGGLVDG